MSEKLLEKEEGTLIKEETGKPMAEEQGTVLEAETEKPMAEEALDDPLSIDDVDFTSTTDEDISELDDMSLGEIDDTISAPHIKIDAKDFKNMLKVANALSESGTSVHNKSVYFTVVNNKLMCEVTNGVVKYTQYIDIENMDNRLKGSFAVLTNPLTKISKAIGNKVIIFKQEDAYIIKLYGGGELPLEIIDFIPKTAFKEIPEEFSEIGTIQSNELYSLIKDASPVVAAGVEKSDRTLTVRDGKASTKYLWALTKSVIDLPNLTLLSKDISVLKICLAGKDVSTLSIGMSKNEKFYSIASDTFEYIYSSAEGFNDAILEQKYTSITEKQSPVIVETVQLMKLIELSASLSYSSSLLRFNKTSDGIKIELKLSSKNGGKLVEFNLQGSSTSSEETHFEDFYNARMLFMVLKYYQAKTTVSIAVTAEGIAFSSEGSQTIVLLHKEHESAGKKTKKGK